MVPSQKHGFHPRIGTFLNLHRESVYNSDDFCFFNVAPFYRSWRALIASFITPLSQSDLSWPNSLSNQSYLPHLILYILDRIIFRLTCDHIGPLSEAPTGSVCGIRYQWATSSILLFFPPLTIPTLILQNVPRFTFSGFSQVEPVLSSLGPSHIWDLTLKLFTYISVFPTKPSSLRVENLYP